jgi:hypothetical protein
MAVAAAVKVVVAVVPVLTVKVTAGVTQGLNGEPLDVTSPSIELLDTNKHASLLFLEKKTLK